jgi:Leucine-rich repeat (LRR) protein
VTPTVVAAWAPSRRLTSLAGLANLPRLTTLDVSYTGITSIKTLSSFHSLKTLYLPKGVSSLDGLPASVCHLGLRQSP